ncbi:MAG: 30S ribosomal protein S6 [Capsulimonadales bacterium]|nr:30S ribosomal protein S6 [Capsulimonadales bacterium]
METAYEAVFILDTALPDEQIRAVIDKYTGIIANNGGTVDDIDRWDPRRLAYEINGRREGIYIIVNFHSSSAVRNELDRIFRISDDTLRYLIVKQDKKADRYPSRIRAAEQERREREQAARAAAAAATQTQPVTDLSALNNGGGVANEESPEAGSATPSGTEADE